MTPGDAASVWGFHEATPGPRRRGQTERGRDVARREGGGRVEGGGVRRRARGRMPGVAVDGVTPAGKGECIRRPPWEGRVRGAAAWGRGDRRIAGRAPRRAPSARRGAVARTWSTATVSWLQDARAPCRTFRGWWRHRVRCAGSCESRPAARAGRGDEGPRRAKGSWSRGPWCER